MTKVLEQGELPAGIFYRQAAEVVVPLMEGKATTDEIGNMISAVAFAVKQAELSGFQRRTKESVVSIPMIFNCPYCGEQHVDRPELETGWMNPPHKKHLCSECGLIWKPANVYTTGVAILDETPEFAGVADFSLRFLIRDTAHKLNLRKFSRVFGLQDKLNFKIFCIQNWKVPSVMAPVALSVSTTYTYCFTAENPEQAFKDMASYLPIKDYLGDYEAATALITMGDNFPSQEICDQVSIVQIFLSQQLRIAEKEGL